MKKIYISLSIFLVITLLSSVVFATTSSKFEVVEDNICTIKINDYCEFEKRMINYDLNKRQVTIQLKITNTTPADKPTGEVMLVLDDSNSMNETTASGEKRGDLVFGSAKTLVNKMLQNNDNLKVGIVKFSTNADLNLEGTLQDASLVSELTNDKLALTNAIDNIDKAGIRTDLDSGLTLAKEHFSKENNNKYIIVLTDGVPNVALSLEKSKQGFTDSVINKTKATLQSFATNYNLITMLTGISNADALATASSYTYGQIVEKIFGTTNNPTVGKFYYITDSQIENTINNDIYNSLVPVPQAITDINVNDYFPQEIIDNFDFAYIAQPTKGTISPAIDSNNRIVWSIDSLNSGEEAVVQYTLTLKDNYNSDIVNVILDTNEKVDITYKNPDGTDGSKTSTDTPKVRITEVSTPTPAKTDTTIAKTILPKAGSPAMLTLCGFLFSITVFSGLKLLKISKKVK